MSSSDADAFDFSEAPDIARLLFGDGTAPDALDGALAALHRDRMARSREHRAQATRLRAAQGRRIAEIERRFAGALACLDEWLALDGLAARSPQQQARYATLSREVGALEEHVSQQWDALTGALNQASEHERAARALRLDDA